MRIHCAVGLTTTIPTTLIGNLGEEALLEVTQDPPAIIQVENPYLTFYTSSFPFYNNEKNKNNDNDNDNDNLFIYIALFNIMIKSALLYGYSH